MSDLQTSTQHASKNACGSAVNRGLFGIRTSQVRNITFVVFFVAVAAAGIPFDRITIVIGALGVGIGFGLQNILESQL